MELKECSGELQVYMNGFAGSRYAATCYGHLRRGTRQRRHALGVQKDWQKVGVSAVSFAICVHTNEWSKGWAWVARTIRNCPLGCLSKPVRRLLQHLQLPMSTPGNATSRVF